MEFTSHEFISCFELQQRAELSQVAIVEHFPEKKIIFKDGKIPDFLYLVLEGQVDFSTHIDRHQYETVGKVNANEFFGEFGVLDRQNYCTMAVAQPSTILAKIPRDKLTEILQNSNGYLITKLFNYINKNLCSTRDQYISGILRKNKLVLVGEMVNTIVHDFKSPFTGIQLASEMIKELHYDEETQEWCNLIQIQVMRMLNMAEEVLEFARGSSVCNKQTINIKNILQKFEKLNRIYWEISQVKYVIKTEDIFINADESKLMRVLQNLVGNSVDAFNGHGGQIEITATVKEPWIEIKVVDDGPGIPEHIRENLFEAFITYGKQSGTGLGTAIAKSIVDAHDGEITFDSQISKGTTFYVRLPQINAF
ncbi:MAG: ATP-binding protein [Microcoleaceae cyanobacterium]